MKKPAKLGAKFMKATQPADRERKPKKMYRPPTAKWRTVGVYLLWGAVILTLLLSLTNRNTDTGPTEMVIPEENRATATEAVEFAKLFTSTYFTWDADSDSFRSRAEKLEPMMAEGVDPDAGLQVADIEWDSRLNTARIVKVEEVGKNKALITLAVRQHLAKGDEKETNETLFTVPVGFAKAYGVYDLPSFSAIDTATEVEAERIQGSPVPTDVEQNVKAFLGTFFQSYATDKVDKLSYFLEDESNPKGLEGSLDFESVKDSLVLEQTAGIYNVSATVNFIDPQTKIKYTTKYLLEVTEKDGRYTVSQLKGGN